MKAVFALLLVATAVSLASCESGTAQAACAGGDECLPDVKYIDTAGVAHTPQSLRGKVVVINFWATWCGPCKKEIPDLSKLYLKYKDKGVVMLGILTNDNPSEADLLNFQSDAVMEFPIVRQSSDILVSFNYPQALPTTFIYDRSGHRVGKPRVGAIKAEDMDATLAQLTAGK
jgi:cytochrome c biogenesis protein CcmG, thiol:disulfide interchange protein DsbE